jgi:carbonic anhydrase
MTHLDTKLSSSAEQELQRLIEGNQRFVRGEARFPTVCKETLAALTKGQEPFATILGCSDSRVPPELIFDANFGDLFIIRVAGNVISPEIKGSLQYAGAHLHTPLFVVLGHEDCGAVQAALQYGRHGSREASHIQLLVDNINRGLHITYDSDDQHLLTKAVEANVRWSMKQIRETPEWRHAKTGGAKLVGAVFELATGEVRFLRTGFARRATHAA